MNWAKSKYIIFSFGLLIQYSCGVIDKASRHGFDNGYYIRSQNGEKEKVYLSVTEDSAIVYPIIENKPGKTGIVLPLREADSLYQIPSRFHKTSLDVDITSIFFKYRPKTMELPMQLSAELNIALYAGWRHDYYRIVGKKDPIGKTLYKVVNRGFDFGILAGPGTTFIGPSTTKNSISQEYNGMIIEYGIAAFLESNFASFGIATGFDHLLGSDRDVWIYNKRPWIGFVVGIALN
jgi:hypothetical protein